MYIISSFNKDLLIFSFPPTRFPASYVFLIYFYSRFQKQSYLFLMYFLSLGFPADGGDQEPPGSTTDGPGSLQPQHHTHPRGGGGDAGCRHAPRVYGEHSETMRRVSVSWLPIMSKYMKRRRKRGDASWKYPVTMRNIKGEEERREEERMR